MKTKILVKKIEGINRFVFEKKYKKIRELIRQKTKNTHGVYALYSNSDKLYYVGQTKKDIINRVKCHLTGTHSGKWQYFSIYFTRNKDQAREVESIILSVLPKVKGNKQNRSKMGEDKKLKQEIPRLKKAIDKGNPILASIGPKRRQAKKSNRKKTAQGNSKAGNKRFSLAGLFSENKLLRGEHKKNIHSACLLTSGKVLYKGKGYSSPSGASKVAKGLKTDNGWTFWQIQDHQKRWITLNDLKKKGTLKKVA